MATSPYASETYLQQLLAKAVSAKASDIHLKVGQPPGARVRGDMVYFRLDKIRPEDTEAAARLLIRRPDILAKLDELREHDASYAVTGLGRFRVNVYRQRGTLAIVLRHIPMSIPTFEELGAPFACRELAERSQGLVLLCGASGSGKSSTLAAMVGHMNKTRALHIVTIEDPVEFLHMDDRSSVSQREIGIDTADFSSALRSALRQDPDVILVGEIRDEDTMQTALKAAETGHLVLATLHTPDVARTVPRILALLGPQSDQAESRKRLADALEGIIAQRLVPRADGSGQVLVAEVLVGTGTARESIRQPATNPPLKEIMEKGVSPYGMQTFEMHVRKLVETGVVDRDEARAMQVGFN